MWIKLDELAQYKKGPFGSSLTKAMFVPDSESAFKVYEQKNAIQKDATLGTYYISETHFEKLKGFEVLPNDIIVSCAGTIGETYIMPQGIKRGIINQALMYIRPYLPSITPFYLIYFDSIIKGDSKMDSKGTAMKNIPPFEILKNYLFPLPPLAEQTRIIQELEKWFGLIDEIETNKKDLQGVVKQVKSNILSLAISGKLVVQDPNDEPAIELLKRINPNFIPCDNSHYGNLPCEIPKSWVWVKMKDIAVSELGKTLDRGKNTGKPYDYLCALNVKWGTFDFTTLKQILLEDYEKERYLVRKGDLLICEGGDVGRAAIWESDREIYYQNALHRVRFKGNINQYFYLYILQYYKWLGLIDDVSGGVTIKHFTQNSMQKLLFPMPPVAEQKRIVQRINDIFSTLDAITTEL